MVPRGLEPRTLQLLAVRSNQLSYESSCDIFRLMPISSVKIGTIQRRLAWPLREDDTHKSRSVIIIFAVPC